MSFASRVPARIQTARLVLRPYTEADAAPLAEVVTRNLDHLATYMEWTAHEPQSVEQRRAWIAEESARWAAGTEFTMGMFDAEGALLGGTGFHVLTDPERLAIGYWIDAAHQGMGLVTEAAAALTLVALETAGSPEVVIEHAASNARSAAVPRRLGYVQRDTSRTACFDAGSTTPAVTWVADAATLAREPLASWPRPVLA